MQPTTNASDPAVYVPDPPAEPPKRKTNRLLDAHRALVDRYAGDADRRFFDSDNFPWAKDLEANWRTIRRDLDEALALRDQIPGFGGVSTRQRRIADDRWKTLVFYFFGRRVAENCDRFPETAALIDRIPGMKTAMFSILTEGGHIPPHYGPYKGVLRYHLGLRVPPGNVAGIRVGDQVRHWAEGEGFFFDDTFEHEAWNRGPGDRVVLFVDILRPFPRGLDAFNRAFFQLVKNSPDVREVQARASFFARLARKARGQSAG
ncbi:MAG TPA: aspartyl/asparaginyl beta-hydroxylase domain-containing protein [Polyangiaceae bacterium]|nr:aspartyl/asparaginyl beta-hydroxylase domain-containing protein [Polyangiaceae bacterium]